MTEEAQETVNVHIMMQNGNEDADYRNFLISRTGTVVSKAMEDELVTLDCVDENGDNVGVLAYTETNDDVVSFYPVAKLFGPNEMPHDMYTAPEMETRH